MKRRVFLEVLGAAALPGQVTTRAASDTDIHQILRDRIDKYQQSVGIVVGVIDAGERRIVSYGHLDQGDPKPLDGETVFEIGSNTKVFTSLLLADMVHRGELKFEDPLARYLPPEVRVPEYRGKEITLVDLATHTSGLPRDPSDLQGADTRNPFARITDDQLYRSMAGLELTYDIGSRYRYSSIGTALLGIALSRRAGLDYETLLRDRVTDPLSMASTRANVTPEMQPRLASGHVYVTKESAPPFQTGAYAPAGAIRSTANDLIEFLAANIGYVDTPLASALTLMRQVHRGPMLLGWGTANVAGTEIIHHNGGTPGMNSFIGFNPRTRVGVAVLSNTGSGGPIDDIGFHLLNSRYSLRNAKQLAPPKRRTQVAVDAKVLDRYVGRYRISKDDILTVTRAEGRLLVQRTGALIDEMVPESDRDFFCTSFDDQISFKVDALGRAQEAVYHEGGNLFRAKRVD